jgi:tripartite-type tricarboxylate transporter receptor subunit TctC
MPRPPIPTGCWRNWWVQRDRDWRKLTFCRPPGNQGRHSLKIKINAHNPDVRGTIMSRILSLLAAAGVLFAGAPAHAQGAADYPNKPVKVIVTVPAGGGVDTVTRLITERLRVKLGQPFVIENKGGAGGNIAAEAAFQAAPDGYTLMASQPAPITTNATLYKKLNFDPTAFEPVAIMSSIPNTLLVKNDFPAKTLAEFMAYVKANPGKLNYASQGPGTTSHLTAELFNKLAGVKMTHVPYKGTGPALNDIVAGHVDLIFMQLEAALRLH